MCADSYSLNSSEVCTSCSIWNAWPERYGEGGGEEVVGDLEEWQDAERCTVAPTAQDAERRAAAAAAQEDDKHKWWFDLCAVALFIS